MNEINFFAQTSARGTRQKFGIKLDDRRRHMYVIGKTGMGKTQMLQNMAIQDVIAGRGVGIIDPHGEFAEAVLDFVPKSRINDVVYFNPADTEMPIGFNIMEAVGTEQNHLIAAGLMAAFKKIWVDVWSARMEYILNNTLLALLEYPNATIMGANRMLADKDYRKKVVDNVKDPAVKSYWINEFAKYPERYREEATGAIQNKIGQFISNPLVRNIIGQTKSTFNMREIMDNKKILIINLSKGRIGEDNTALLGTMLITKLQISAMSRVDTPEDERNDFFMYIDEFQTFSTPSFAGILSEARKYRLALILAHQYITQMDEIVRDAVFGNAGTLVSFRVGAADAEFMENEFIPAFLQTDLVNLGKYNIAIKLMIDGIASNAFSATTLPPFVQPEESNREKIIRVSRERHGRSKEVVSEKIARWSGVISGEGSSKEGDQQPASKVSHNEIKEGFDAECSDCKRSIKVPFKPDPNRPVYCRECFEKRKEAREKGSPLPPSSVQKTESKTSSAQQSSTEVSSFVKTPIDKSVEDKQVVRQTTRDRRPYSGSRFTSPDVASPRPQNFTSNRFDRSETKGEREVERGDQETSAGSRNIKGQVPLRPRFAPASLPRSAELRKSTAPKASEGDSTEQVRSSLAPSELRKDKQEISLKDLPARSDQSRSEARPRGAARIDAKESGKSRKKVNLASLRESLEEVVPKKEISGIIKEGESIKF